MRPLSQHPQAPSAGSALAHRNGEPRKGVGKRERQVEVRCSLSGCEEGTPVFLHRRGLLVVTDLEAAVLRGLLKVTAPIAPGMGDQTVGGDVRGLGTNVPLP